MKIVISPDGTAATVSDANEGKQNPDGSAAVRTWQMDIDQLGKHSRGIASPDHPWKTASAGDKSAMLDAVAADLAERKARDK